MLGFALSLQTSFAGTLNLTAFQEVYAMGSKTKAPDIIYVTSNGSLGKKGDPDVQTAIRLALTNESEHLVMQDVPTAAETKDLKVSVEAWMSSDFRHTGGDGQWKDAEPGIYYIQGMIVHPNVDFWFLRTPGFGYKLTNLQQKHWITVEANFTSPRASKTHHLEFHVPAGTGFLYLKNFSVKP